MKNLKKLSTGIQRFVYKGVEKTGGSSTEDESLNTLEKASKKFFELTKEVKKKPELKKELDAVQVILDRFIEEKLKLFTCAKNNNAPIRKTVDDIRKNIGSEGLNDQSIRDILVKNGDKSCEVEGGGDKSGVKLGDAAKEKIATAPNTIEFSLGEKGKAQGTPVLSADGKSINGQEITGIPKGHVIDSITVGDDGKISITHKEGTEAPKSIKINGKKVKLGGKSSIDLRKKHEAPKAMDDLSVYGRKVEEIDAALKDIVKFSKGARIQYLEDINSNINALEKRIIENPKEKDKYQALLKKFKAQKEKIINLKVEKNSRIGFGSLTEEKARESYLSSVTTEEDKNRTLEDVLKSKEEGGLGITKDSERYKALEKQFNTQIEAAWETKFSMVESEETRDEKLEDVLKSKADGGLGLTKDSDEYKKLEKRFNEQIKKERDRTESALLENVTTRGNAESMLNSIGYKKGSKEYKRFQKKLDKRLKDLEKVAKKGQEKGTQKEADEKKAEKVKKHKRDIADVKKQMDAMTDKASDEYKKLEAKHKKLTDDLKKLEEKETLDELGKEFSDKIDEVVKRQAELEELRKNKKPSDEDKKKIGKLEKEGKDDLVGFGESGLKDSEMPEEWKKEDEAIKALKKKEKIKDDNALREKLAKKFGESIKGKSDAQILDMMEKNPEGSNAYFMEKQADGTVKVNFHGVNENLIGMGHFEKNLMSKFKYVRVTNPKTGQTVIGVRRAGQGNKPGYFDINTGKYIPIFSGSTIKGLNAEDISKMSVSVKNAMGNPRNKVVSLTDYLKASKIQRKAYKGQVERGGVRATASLADLKFEPGTEGLLNTIASAEGTGNNYDARYGSGRGHNPQLSKMTLNEVLNYQRANRRKNGSSACGRYQFMRRTLIGLKSKLGLSGNEIFNKSLQDKLAIQLLRRRGLDRFKSGSMSAPAFQRELAKEWASLPVNGTGRTHYNDGRNMTQATRGRHGQLQQNFASIRSGQ